MINNKMMVYICALFCLYILTSCTTSSSSQTAAILKATRPVQVDYPDSRTTIYSIDKAHASSNASMSAIKRAQDNVKQAIENSKDNALIITRYEDLVSELRHTDIEMSNKLAALTRESKLLDVKRTSTIDALRLELDTAGNTIRETKEALDTASVKIYTLSQEVERAWSELVQYRKQREAIENAVIKSEEDLTKANSEAVKYKEKYLKLTKYRWIVIGLGVWLISKIAIGLSSFTPQGRIARAIL